MTKTIYAVLVALVVALCLFGANAGMMDEHAQRVADLSPIEACNG